VRSPTRRANRRRQQCALRHRRGATSTGRGRSTRSVDPLTARPMPRSLGRRYGVLGIPTISYLPADDVDDSALPAGELIQHLEDDVDGWWVSATRYGETIEIRIYDVATVWLDASLAFCTVRPAF